MRLSDRIRKLETAAHHASRAEDRTALLMRLALEACDASERAALAALIDRVTAGTAESEEAGRFAAFCAERCPPAVMLFV